MGKRKRSGSFTKTDDYGAKKSDDCDSQEELDGDPLIPLKNSNGVRCSARVQEKQEKLRREASPSKQIVVDFNMPGPPGTNVAAASALAKATRRLVFPDEFDVPSTEELTVRLKLNSKDKRKKRNWELWSLEDKQLFFEALNEHGKDFDAIQNYFATKLKPKSKAGQCLQPLSKNKDQVRHFYYRTWNKISKYLQFPKDMKKGFQELYGLVNYGELRKKLRVLNSKTSVKLSELVQKGTTAIKVRGKTFRIKTPVCRALKRLNRLDDIEHSRVPCKISLELIPKNGKAWAAVQAVSHNPRVKVHVPLQRTLASVITYFEDKWKSKSERLKQEMAYTFGGKPVPRLRVFPFDKNDVNLPIFKLSENTSSAKISLRSYTENVLCKEMDEELELCTKKLKRRRKQTDEYGPSGYKGPLPGIHYSSMINESEAYDSQAEADASDIDTPDALPSDSERVMKQLYDSSDEVFPFNTFVQLQSNDSEEITPTKLFDMYSEKMGKYSSFDHLMESGYNVDNPTDVDELENATDDCLPESADLAPVCSVCSSNNSESEDMLAHVWDEETVKRGWTAVEAGVMTVGELYLMMGKCEKLCFEYCWDQSEESEDRAKINGMLERLANLASSLKKRKSGRAKTLTGTGSSGANVCAHCGHKEVAPTHNPIVPVLNPVATVAVNTVKPATPTIHFKVLSRIGPEINPPPTVATSLPTTSEPVVSNIAFSTAIVPVTVFSGATKTARSILPTPISLSTELSHQVTANKSNKPQPCDSTPTVTHLLTTAVPAASPTPVVPDLPPELPEEPESTAKIVPPAPPTTGPSDSIVTISINSPVAVPEEVDPAPTEPILPASQPIASKPPKEKQAGSSSRRPGQIPICCAVSDQKTTPPKPFLDLPKGNRRLGRKPNWKRMVIPRELPLLPKCMTPSSVIALTTKPGSSSGSIIMSSSKSSIFIPIGQSIVTLPTMSADNLISSLSTIPVTPSVSTEGPSTPNVPSTSGTPKRIPLTPEPKPTSSTRERKPPPAPSKRNFPVNRTASGPSMNICDEILNVKSISSSSFDDLLKVRQQDAQHAAAEMESNLSLSSFMEISLPESTKLEANEFTADRFLDMGMDESIQSNLSMSDFQVRGSDLVLAKSVMTKDVNEFFELQNGKKRSKKSEDLHTPIKVLPGESSRSRSPSFPSQSQSFLDNQWSEPGELSLSSLLGIMEPMRSTNTITESEYQSMIEEPTQEEFDFEARFADIINGSIGSKNKK